MTIQAASDADFYEGKTIRVLVGSRRGVAYDLYARLLAQHIGKYLPGWPSFAVENMAEAGARGVAGIVFRAKPDGLTLGAISPELCLSQLLGAKETAGDWARFSWIGTLDRSSHLLYMRADTGYKSIFDIIGASQPPRCGASGNTSLGFYLPKLLQEIVGAKFSMVTGYGEGPDVDTAVERGELDCRALTVSGFFSHEPYPSWLRSGFVRVLLQTGKRRDSRLPEAPTIYELMNEHRVDESGRRLAQVVLSAALFGRPIVAPPGIHAERIKMLRDAFQKAASDPELLAEAKERNLGITPASGAELEWLASEMTSKAREILERLKRLSS